jgi:hypothetical protein
MRPPLNKQAGFHACNSSYTEEQVGEFQFQAGPGEKARASSWKKTKGKQGLQAWLKW